MIFTIEPTVVSLMLFDGASLTLEMAVDRSYFEPNFSGLDYSNIRQLSYEPEKNYYHLIDKNGSFYSYEEPSQNENMTWVQQNWSELVSFFEQEKVKEEEAAAAMNNQ